MVDFYVISKVIASKVISFLLALFISLVASLSNPTYILLAISFFKSVTLSSLNPYKLSFSVYNLDDCIF